MDIKLNFMNIKMRFQGKLLTFQVTYQCPEYLFCECNENPAARGFFTMGYVKENHLKQDQ